MFRFKIIYIIVLISSACKNNTPIKIIEPKSDFENWLNPLFYNSDFESELNFPFWFNDSLVKSHNIRRISKRIYENVEKDSNGHAIIPKSKIEFYFDQNGYVDEIYKYFYYDDREISRISFKFSGNISNNFFRKVTKTPEINLLQYKEDLFSTNHLKLQNFSLYDFISKKRKYVAYKNQTNQEQLYVVPNKKYWGALSIDSIIKPKKNDWIILGNMKRPHKRFKTEQIVKESSVYLYEYYSNKILKSIKKEFYPLSYSRHFVYNNKGKWVNYIDSTFSEKSYITHATNEILFDEFDRPNRIIHTSVHDNQKMTFYIETIHYQTWK